jgi:hypothetical protein
VPGRRGATSNAAQLSLAGATALSRRLLAATGTAAGSSHAARVDEPGARLQRAVSAGGRSGCLMSFTDIRGHSCDELRNAPYGWSAVAASGQMLDRCRVHFG